MKPIIFLAFANDKVDNARYLRNLPLELDGIRKALQPAVKEGLCEIIERANVSIEQIFDVFQSYQDRIAIFHYGGHADGYQLLLETTQSVANSPNSGSVSDSMGTNKVAHGEGLVSFFARQKGLQLVFFNGCSTQQQSLELVKAGIPAVIGTSNSINDDIATTLSIRFYTGLAKGASIDKAWAEAIDEVKMKEGTANLRGLYRKTQTEVTLDRFPWEIYYREGAEKVKEWNLPEEVDNPLFGLPNIPPIFTLPESPFLFLKRYERPHAELFFGRSFYVRELYNKITDTQSPPVILLYGQSGTGKSSLFDAGLNPRLESSHHVIYLRRNQLLGLVGTLEEGLDTTSPLTTKGEGENTDLLLSTSKGKKVSSEGGDLEGVSNRLLLLQTLKNQLLSIAESEKINLSETIEVLERELFVGKTAMESSVGSGVPPTLTTAQKFNEQRFLAQIGETPFLELLKAWHSLENQFQKPLLVILDQAEELFTRPNKSIPNELEDLAQCLKAIFNNPVFAPQGKLILGYRKEYQAEFEERFKECAIPRTKVFLEPLSRKDILDIFRGLTETPNLKKRYNLQIDKNLPIVVADDLLEDKDSPVAPVLQILLTKMWDKVRDQPKPMFTVEMYQNMKREGFLLDDFFKQQTKKLAEWNEELERSGLALDILYFHTTNLGTAGSKTLQEIREHYCHIPEKAELLLYKLKELYLLVEAGLDRTNLTHDTLAPLVRNEYRKSERAGQRASRMLENQVNDFQLNNKQVLDELEVEIVERGRDGMRVWEEDENKFVQASQAARNEKEKARKRRKRYAIAALSAILITALFSLYQWNKSSKNADEAKMKELMLRAGRMMESHSNSSAGRDTINKALRVAEQATIFATHEENKEKIDVFEDFRKLSEAYRTLNEQGKFWLPPHYTINYKQGTIELNEAVQNKIADPAFNTMRGSTLEFSKNTKDTPIFYESLEGKVFYKNTLDNQYLVIWIKNHSFRIFSYLRDRFTKTTIIKADSNIVDFLAIDSTHWFVRDNKDQIKTFNIEDESYQLIAKLANDSLPYNKFQFVRYRNQELIVWYDRFLLKISPKKNTDWNSPKVDTLYSLGYGDYKTDIDNGATMVFSKDLSRFVIYLGAKATLFAKTDGNNDYRILNIEDFKPYSSIVSFSPDLSKICFANRENNFSLYDLQIQQDKVVLDEVFNKSIRAPKSSIQRIQISPDDKGYILVSINNGEAEDKIEGRIYNFQENLIDIYKVSKNTVFSDDGKYIIDKFTTITDNDSTKNTLLLRMPIYELLDWIDDTPAKELTPEDKLYYQIASLSEQWGIPKTRLEILAQALSFLTILLLLIRYIPILIHLYKEERYYKIVLYGLATIIFACAVVYRGFFTEIEEDFIKKASEFFILLSLYYLLVILFEQRQEITQFIKEKNWTSLFLFSAPEIIVIGINVYAILDLLDFPDKNLLPNEGIAIVVALLYPFNSLVLWTIHLSESSFKQGNYIKTLGLLFFGFIYISVFSGVYANINDIDAHASQLIGTYICVWLSLWAGKEMYQITKPKIQHFVQEEKWLSLILYALPEIVLLSTFLYSDFIMSRFIDITKLPPSISISFGGIIIFFLFWILSLSKKSFGEHKYIKVFGLFIIPLTYLMLVFDVASNIVIAIDVLYFILWLVLWIGKGSLDGFKKRFLRKPLSK